MLDTKIIKNEKQRRKEKASSKQSDMKNMSLLTKSKKMDTRS